MAAVVGGTSFTILRIRHDAKSAAGPALRPSPRALSSSSSTSSPPPAAAGAADSLALWVGSSRHHYHNFSGRRDSKDDTVHHHIWRTERKKRSWKCFAELKKSDPDAVESTNPSSPPNCCNDGATEQGDNNSPSGTSLRGEEEGFGANSQQEFVTYGPDKRGNQIVALASATIAVSLFLSERLAGGEGALPDLAASAVPYEQAMTNGRPTVVEFYADWCEVCKETARDVFKVEQEYRDRINFVMLNVDNSKWEQELDEFGVEGIPHFAFLDSRGNEEGNIVGRLPRKILMENLAALARGDATVPHSRVVGQFSSAASRSAPPVVEPRSHSPMS